MQRTPLHLRGCHLLAAAFACTALPAAAEEESAEEESAEEEGMEIIVFGELELNRRRLQLETDLRQLGYRQEIRKEGKSIYRPETQWKPTYIVHDSGHVELRRTPPRFEPWIEGRKDNKWRYISCLPPFTPMCIKASGWVVSKRRLQHSKTDIVERTYPSVLSWQEAVAERATEQRLSEDIPDILSGVWEEGRHWRSEEDLEGPKERRDTLSDFLSTRNCTPEGLAAKDVVLLFIEEEVQNSDFPFTEAEMEALTEAAKCAKYLDDPVSKE